MDACIALEQSLIMDLYEFKNEILKRLLSYFIRAVQTQYLEHLTEKRNKVSVEWSTATIMNKVCDFKLKLLDQAMTLQNDDTRKNSLILTSSSAHCSIMSELTKRLDLATLKKMAAS